MNFYNNHKSWILAYVILELIKKQETGIDDTKTITVNDLLQCTNSLKINDFNFNFVKRLKKNLAFENYKIVYKEAKILKVKHYEAML
ncbi:hypothetical protein EZS27_016423 [termite gut metagenome]|uniref:Uncharacterized protein n=1 Tax=termite gut metagenome TaxID=433724 RepID=A0A5J4RQF0_9ZZZZ